VAENGSVFLFVGFAKVEHFVREKGESRGSVVLFADLDSSGVDFSVKISPAWSGVFQRAETVVEVSGVILVKVAIRAGKWWPAALNWVAEEALLALAGISSISIDTVGCCNWASVSSVVALVSWTCACFTISNVALFGSAFAVVAVVGVKAIGVDVAIVKVLIEALVDGD